MSSVVHKTNRYTALSVHMTSQPPLQGLLKLSDTAILVIRPQISGLAKANASESLLSKGIAITF